MKEPLIKSIYNPVEFLGLPLKVVGVGLSPFIGILLLDSLIIKFICFVMIILFFIVVKKLYKQFGNDFEIKLLSFYLNKGVWVSHD